MTIAGNFGGHEMKLERTNTVELQTDPTIDELLERAGDMGRFQFIAFLVLQLVISPNGFLLYNVSYLMMRPELQCFSEVTKAWT